MNNDIEKDYLVDKLAGRLTEYYRNLQASNPSNRGWQPVILPDSKAKEEGFQWAYETAKSNPKFEWREETLEEYRKRKEQTE